MAAMRGPRTKVGNPSWIADERSFALKIVGSEAEEFSYSARNELDWLNEHMAGIFDENETNFAEAFKTPGKLRGKTPRTGRKANELESRVPLSDVFAPKPKEPLKPASPIKETRIPRSPAKIALARTTASPAKQAVPTSLVIDSGFFGSQDVAALDAREDVTRGDVPESPRQRTQGSAETIMPPQRSRIRAAAPPSPGREEEAMDESPDYDEDEEMAESDGFQQHQLESDKDLDAPPTSPLASHPASHTAETEGEHQTHNTNAQAQQAEQVSDDFRSPSDGSSPIRPVVRKSSLTFASLPAREPLTAGKKTSMGTRTSRTSHLDNIRSSYYNRTTGGKSLGNLTQANQDEMVTGDEMDIDEGPRDKAADEQDDVPLNHTKTYTQRLQDQINMLGKPNAQPLQQHKLTAKKTLSLKENTTVQSTPGAFPGPDDDGDDDDWIEPPASVVGTAKGRSVLPKCHSSDKMEAALDKDPIEQPNFGAAGRGGDEEDKDGDVVEQGSAPPELVEPALDEAGADGQPGVDPEVQSLKLAASASNPESRGASGSVRVYTPSKSPSRSFRDSPLKQVKNKLSSILKSSRGLLASSAAVSAEGKSSIVSPSVVRPAGLYTAASTESVIIRAQEEVRDVHTQDEQPGSPERPVARRTRASTEREKEEKRREKEAKRMEAQNDKLEKAREKEREKALVYNREQERIAAMERQVSSKKGEVRTASKETLKPTRISPRRAKAVESESQPADDDVEMEDAPSAPQPAPAPQSIGAGQASRGKEAKRPVRPAKEVLSKAKQTPTVIRVNTGSQHSQLQTTNRLSTASHDTAASSNLQSQSRLLNKSSKASLHAKSSTSSMRAPSSVNRARAMDLAAKKKEVEEREAQRRRDNRAEMERKRAEEDQRKQERFRRQETERQKQHGPDLASEGKTPAERRAALERAKQTRAPPPAVRSQPNGPPDSTAGDKSATTASGARGEAGRPQSRTTYRSQDEPNRLVNAVLSSTSKTGAKRGFGPDRADENQAKRAPSRGGPSYQANEAKRRRTSEMFDDDAEIDHSRNIKGPPVRPSGGFKKDMLPKPMYGYANASQSHSASRDLFKATVTSQHNVQAKAAHPLDMAQISKGGIPFAPNNSLAYKTPARPGANAVVKSAIKSAARSSPRFQNGETIELPEIQTDDEDEDDDEANGMSVAAWADSPDLRRALMRQETMDPSQIFGPPAPLNMEEVFNKNKERWHKFRARTSSANWGGADRLTEEDIRRDLAARDKLRREGGWSYEMSKEMI
ncbi:inner centromere protein [Ophiocordyceps camponoti-floridani]|uniref:Inner centromere protein n=1 Tax=Ophiocordyceps camponoti-floridani TaxID=2030778 RepID=A0A8H4Q633_9HYPO|nr:inner centromere protein [Ophiocordyceps camponoti-floridani]